MQTVSEFKSELQQIFDKLKQAKSKMDLPGIESKAEALKTSMNNEDFWQNPDQAAKVTQQLKFYESTIEKWSSIESQIEETVALLEELSEQDFADLTDEFVQLLATANSLYISSLLNQKHDQNNAILSVICGTGGKDAQDFTALLARMYFRYAEKNNFKITKIEETPAEDVGLKNITFLIEGPYAYGYLKAEHGVHRLVRLSSFNSGNTRETSFAMVDVIPEVALEDQVEIKSEDLRVDVFRASGAGGQHVNTTDSAVRITHLPTNIVVSVQSERSQHQNKEKAIQILNGKLVQLMQERNLASLDELRGFKQEMSWGNQIRSYVLHPYKMVKDHRSAFESNNPDKVLDGEIQSFIEAYLAN
jgi:peptide chain release factor 2